MQKRDDEKGSVSSNEQGDMSLHPPPRDSFMSEAPFTSQVSTCLSSQVNGMRASSSPEQEASEECCAAQPGQKAASNVEGKSTLVHPGARNESECSRAVMLEAKPEHSAPFALSGAKSSISSTPNIPGSSQSVVRPQTNLIPPSGSGSLELQDITSSFDRSDQSKSAQFYRTRAFSHGDMSTTDSQNKTLSSSENWSISASHVTDWNPKSSTIPTKQDTGSSHSHNTFPPADLRPRTTEHVPQMEPRNHKSESIMPEPLNKPEPKGLVPVRTQSDSPTGLKNVRASPEDDTRITQKTNEKVPVNREAKIHATLRRATNPRQFFVFGKVFLTLWVEPTGEMQSNTGSNLTVGSGISTVAYGERVFSNIRKFVVIREGERSCTALRIMTYGGLGVAKKGVQKSEHAIIHTGKQAPESEPKERAKRGELGLLPRAIRVAVDDGTEKLDSMSRLDFGKVYTIEHSARVRGIGMIHKKSSEPFLYQFKSVFEKHGAEERYRLSFSADLPNGAHEGSRRWPRQPIDPRLQNGYSQGPSQSIPDPLLPNLRSRSEYQSARAIQIDAASDGGRSEDVETVRPNRTDRTVEGNKVSGNVSTTSSTALMHTRLSGYRPRKDPWFQRYRIFQMLWHNSADDLEKSVCNGDIPSETESQQACEMRSEIYAFVILGGTSHHSLCVPIVVLGIPNSSVSAINPHHRASLYTTDDTDHAWPSKDRGERSAIKVRLHPSRSMLLDGLRLDYSRVHTIAHGNRMKAVGWIHATSRSSFDYDQEYVYRTVTERSPDHVSDSDDSDDSEYHSLVNEDVSNVADEAIGL